MRAKALVMARSCRAAEGGFADWIDSGLGRPLEPIPDIRKPPPRKKPRFVLPPQKLYSSFAASLLTGGRNAFQTTDTVPI
jgi:hypothetical protein